MKFAPAFCRILFVTAACLVLALPAAAEDSHDVLQKNLNEFASKTIESINRCVLPSQGKKEFTRNGDGSYSARYIAINPKSISTSFKKPEKVTGGVTYIGYMRYEEVEYVCSGKTKADADKGPCNPRTSQQLTELVKYVNGKWTY